MFNLLIEKAIERDGTSIAPCRNDWNKSIQIDQGMVSLWCNVIDGSDHPTTHIVSVPEGTKDYILTFTAADVAMKDMLKFNGIQEFIDAMENDTRRR